MKFFGAVYLLYLGIKTIRSKNNVLNLNDLSEIPSHRMFLQGIISNISNPKIAIFYFSYLPQFVPSNHSEPIKLIFILGVNGKLKYQYNGKQFYHSNGNQKYQ
jgi:threonine/homoserine/homoserine lactone efflux protein